MGNQIIWKFPDWGIPFEFPNEKIKVFKVLIVAQLVNEVFSLPYIAIKSARQSVDLSSCFSLKAVFNNVCFFECDFENEHHTELKIDVFSQAFQIIDGSIWIERIEK